VIALACYLALFLLSLYLVFGYLSGYGKDVGWIIAGTGLAAGITALMLSQAPLEADLWITMSWFIGACIGAYIYRFLLPPINISFELLTLSALAPLLLFLSMFRVIAIIEALINGFPIKVNL